MKSFLLPLGSHSAILNFISNWKADDTRAATIGLDSCSQDVQRALIGLGSCPCRALVLVLAKCVCVCVCIISEVTTLPYRTNAFELMFIPLIKLWFGPLWPSLKGGLFKKLQCVCCVRRLFQTLLSSFELEGGSTCISALRLLKCWGNSLGRGLAGMIGHL